MQNISDFVGGVDGGPVVDSLNKQVAHRPGYNLASSLHGTLAVQTKSIAILIKNQESRGLCKAYLGPKPHLAPDLEKKMYCQDWGSNPGELTLSGNHED
jgi:hypothetical protein